MKKSSKDELIVLASIVGFIGAAAILYLIIKNRQTQSLPSAANYNPQVGYDSAAIGAGTSLATLAATVA